VGEGRPSSGGSRSHHRLFRAPEVRGARGGNIWYYVNSDGRKALNGTWQGFYFRDEAGSSAWGVDPSLTWRPASFITFSTGLHVEKQDEDTQWVANTATGSAPHYVFGRIQQTTVGVTTRLNYTITPNLTVQLYAQPFVSAGAYSRFKELASPRAATFAAQFQPYAYAGAPDFNYKSFRTTNVLRWEYKPGSVLYVVWQQGREDVAGYGQFDFRRDFRRTFGLRSTNVFLVKLSYWLNL
jgi:hypothetical protein